MNPLLIIQALQGITRLINELKRTHTWSTEEERFGFESKVKEAIDTLGDADPDNDPDHWRKPYQYINPGQEEGKEE